MNQRPRHPRLVGFAASVALLALLVGLPAVLLALGWGPTPSGLDGWWAALTTPDDGHLTILVLKVAAWIVWGLLAVTIVTEGVAALRGLEAPRLPGLRWSQVPARRLVAAALLLFITVPAAGIETASAVPDSPNPVASPTVTAASQPAKPARPTPSAVALSVDATSSFTHTVKRGETLWSIAEHHLGSGSRYPEILKLNHELLRGKAQFLRPGWVLTLPAGARADGVQATASNDHDHSRYTVVKGDTLSEIAQEHLDDADAWPRIFEASRGIPQPDGRRLTDPDLILPGWHVLIPAAAGATPDLPTTSPEPEQAEPTPQTSQPTPAGAVPSATATPTPVAATSETAVVVPVVPSSAPATPAPSASATVSTDVSSDDKPASEASDRDADAPAPWLLVGLTGAGGVLAAGLLAALRQRRRAQFRARRPGRTIQAPPPELVPVEKTVMTEGQAATPTLLAIDHALRLLAVSGEERDAPPQLLSVQLLPGEVAVQLVEPITLAHPWRPDGNDDRRWLLATGAREHESTARSAYPQLVSVGLDDDGATWLVNLEQLGTISLTGDPTYAADFARYLAAEIAVNPWARQVQLDCIGIAREAEPLDPARIRHHRLEDPTALDAAIAAAGATVDKCAEHDVTAAAGRVDDLGGDVWDSWLVLVNGALSSTPLDQLLALVGGHPARTGTAVVMVADTEPVRGLGVRLTGQGRVLIPSLRLDLIANGLTPAEAEGCALLLAHADLLDDVEMPSDGDDGWREHVDAAGAIRDELVLPRDTDPESVPGATVVPAPDAEVLDVAATTTDDLQQLAPHVPDRVRAAVERSDPDLDADLAAWAAGTRPHLRLLGPIQARTGTTGKPTVVAKRKAFYTELLAFLVLHPQGVTIDQVVDAFGSDATQMRVHLSKVRSWLGVDPTTGGNYLPDATKSPAGIARGMGIYQLVGVLADIDLFRRLRARGQARGPEGLSDLQSALGLVTGEPFTGQRGRGWAWLADGVRIDQHMVCAVVDVAHTVTIAALHSGDLQSARAATETALLAAPYEDTPRLDLAAVVAAEGDRRSAERILRDDVSNRADDGDAPDDLPERTAELVASAPWLKKGRVA
ncbi:LysM peptidoglycan-binding domain-containing protein [Propioniciclava sp. MC1595]|uniref:LysM peptidoglycan-binding domain-containing protein n=1 Tax=Propioniciclava sp. MC1595 TaxID=2760308 RepID=UPI0016625D59|nr:LysM peptidoglycan-binding domain-containing protein [Propioniciclava sp. MC1595]MBB1495462.1 LysM peptidoglycan-binding domain-containing protein [Propioniciclava sp. MC1595]QTE26625.1 LysM peptidoglycan-binding domain-containing protein [Propioniciclava sp. MC1595]